MYRYGYGTELNYKLSFEWFKKAADKNDGYSYYMLGDIYDYGMGDIKANPKKLKNIIKKLLNWAILKQKKE